LPEAVIIACACSLFWAFDTIENQFAMDQHETDEILGIARCARCGHRLEGEIECPFCNAFPDLPPKQSVPKWIYITACFLTSPLSLYFIIKSQNLNAIEKLLCVSGSLFWLIVYGVWF